jgi:Flavodoxin domain
MIAAVQRGSLVVEKSGRRNQMKALVAYASKNGSTAEIRQVIAEELRSHGVEADCREAGEVRDLNPYGAPNALTAFTVETMFSRSRSGSIERTVANCDGW